MGYLNKSLDQSKNNMKKITEEFLHNIVNHLNFSNMTMSDAASTINEYFHKNENSFQVGDTVSIVGQKSNHISENTKAVILVFDPDGFGGHVPDECRYFLKTIDGPKKYFWCAENVMVKT